MDFYRQLVRQLFNFLYYCVAQSQQIVQQDIQDAAHTDQEFGMLIIDMFIVYP